MIALAQGNVSFARSLTLAASLIATLYFLLHSIHARPSQTPATLEANTKTAPYVPPIWAQPEPPFVTKVTALFSRNDLYERVLATHEAHNSLNGYALSVLRERITKEWWSQAAHLLSMVVSELAKPESQRTKWLLWFQPDVVVLNEQIPLEIFLPSGPGLEDIHFLASHDDYGQMDSGVFFLRVHEWTVKLLVEVLALPRTASALQHTLRKDRFAMASVIGSPKFRASVFYQPRHWYNAYALSADSTEYAKGDLQLHFHNAAGDRWRGVSQALDLLSTTPSDFSIPLEETTYANDTQAYWGRVRTAKSLLKLTAGKAYGKETQNALDRLSYATNYEADKGKVLQDAIDGLSKALGLGASDEAAL